MPQLPQRFGFDLPDTFASNCERLADFFQGVLAAVFEAEAAGVQPIALASRAMAQMRFAQRS